MAKLGLADRLAWKQRIDQSAWVDATPWVEPTEVADPPVEFLEAEPSAYRLSRSRSGPPGPPSGNRWTVAVAIAAVGFVLVAVAIMSRPGDQDPFEQLPPDVQQQIRQRQAGPAESVGPTTTADPVTTRPPPSTAAGGEAEREAGPSAGARILDPIPTMRDDLPDDLFGTVTAAGPDGLVVTVDLATRTITERALDNGLGQPVRSSLAVRGPALYLAGGGLVHRLRPDGVTDRPELPAGDLVPADDGFLVSVARNGGRDLHRVTADADGRLVVSDPLAVADDRAIVGGWQGDLLVAKAGTVWRQRADGSATAVIAGQVVVYDGARLVTVGCPSLAACRIDVGSPDQPRQRSVPVPEDMAERDLGRWVGAAVSADGSRLAIAERRAGAVLLTWIDLESGASAPVRLNLLDEPAIAWSPDGRYVAATLATADLVVIRPEDERTWRIVLDRPLEDLVWTGEPPAG